MFHGLELDWMDGYRLVVNAGMCEGAGGEPGIVIPAEYVMDTIHTGLNGLDHGPVVPGQWLFVYMVTNGKVAGSIFSAADTYSGARPPAGFRLVRKLPFAVYVQSDGMMRKFRIQAWPRTRVDYTDFDTTLRYQLLGGTVPEWKPFSAVSFIPPGSHFAHVYVAGQGRLRAPGSGSAGIDVQPGEMLCQTDSDRCIDVLGGPLAVWVRGWTWNEPD